MRTSSPVPNSTKQTHGSNICRGINVATQNGTTLKVFVEAVRGIDAVRSNVSQPIPIKARKSA